MITNHLNKNNNLNFDKDVDNFASFNSLEKLFGSLEVPLEFKEKIKDVSILEDEYTERFGDIICCDEEYNNMSLDEQIQTIKKCLKANKPKNIILDGYVTTDENKNQNNILKYLKVFY